MMATESCHEQSDDGISNRDALDDETPQEKAKDVGKVEQTEIQVSSDEGATTSSEVNEKNVEEQPLNEVPVDYGQSVPEDKDMYSTRQ